MIQRQVVFVLLSAKSIVPVLVLEVLTMPHNLQEVRALPLSPWRFTALQLQQVGPSIKNWIIVQQRMEITP